MMIILWLSFILFYIKIKLIKKKVIFYIQYFDRLYILYVIISAICHIINIAVYINSSYSYKL